MKIVAGQTLDGRRSGAGQPRRSPAEHSVLRRVGPFGLLVVAARIGALVVSIPPGESAVFTLSLLPKLGQPGDGLSAAAALASAV